MLDVVEDSEVVGRVVKLVVVVVVLVDFAGAATKK